MFQNFSAFCCLRMLFWIIEGLILFDFFRLCRNLKSSICGFEDNPIRGRVKLVHKGA